MVQPTVISARQPGKQPGLAGGYGGQDLLELFRRPVVGQLAGGAYVPNSTVADFIISSAMSSTEVSRGVLTLMPKPHQKHPEWQTLHRSLPLLSSPEVQFLSCTPNVKMPLMLVPHRFMVDETAHAVIGASSRSSMLVIHVWVDRCHSAD